MELHWITEAPAKPQSLDDTLYAQVISQPRPYSVAIFEGAQHDPELSERDGRPRFRSSIMIAIRIMGETDFMSTPITEEHKQRFPRAWGIFQRERDKWSSTIPIALLNGATEADRMELEALGITDVDALAASDPLPENLDHLRLLAKRVRKPHIRIGA